MPLPHIGVDAISYHLIEHARAHEHHHHETERRCREHVAAVRELPAEVAVTERESGQ